ncbi:hypothetical protein L596_019112 [Steinernema carpocapsae]|uniref:Uncharacterized protein n=1 Tax=Steinernema carpocapsae TaxID=34508 RepID=A0A4U5N8N3_STECR|nr:hypothetical protein L596_019112 [Steinernema carpocapsae]
MSEGSGAASAESTEGSKTRKRPEIQIYRPGMMRKGTDITQMAKPSSTLSLTNSAAKNSSSEQKPSQHRKKDSGYRRSGGGSNRNPKPRGHSYNESHNSSLNEIRSDSGETTGFETVAYRQQRNRRGGGAPKSGQNSISSSRQGSVADLNEHQHYEPPARNRGPKVAVNSNAGRNRNYNSSQSLYDRPLTFNRRDYDDEPRAYRNNNKPRQPQIRSQHGPNFSGNPHDYYSSRGGDESRFGDNQSLGGGGGIRPSSNRRRLNSTRSIQSERPANRLDSGSQLGANDFDDTQSYAGEPFASCDDLISQAGSVNSVTPSLLSIESIFKEHSASFDWSAEMAKQEEQEKEAQERAKREASGGPPLRGAASPMASNLRGIISVRPSDLSGFIETDSRNRRGGNRRTPRHRNDSPSKSSVSESIQETPSEDEGAQTPTSERQEAHSRRILSNGSQIYSGRYSPIPNPNSRGYPVDNDRYWRPGAETEYDFFHLLNKQNWENNLCELRRWQFFTNVSARAQTEPEKSKRSPESPSIAAFGTFDASGELGNGHVRYSNFVSFFACSIQRHPVEAAGPESPRHRSSVFSAVEREISQKYSAEMKRSLEHIEGLCENVSTGNVSSGKELIGVSAKLAEIYHTVLVLDIEYTYSNRTDLFMWKQCFYGPIESLRSASNTSNPTGKEFRNILIDFVDNTIKFYENLLHAMEEKYSFKILDHLYWPNGLPGEELYGCAVVGGGAKLGATRDIKFALLSIQRHMVHIGDLHRYKVMIRGIKDYSFSRLWYSKGAQLNPSNGRTYNQLALIATYAIMQRNPLRSRRDSAFLRVGSFIQARKMLEQP